MNACANKHSLRNLIIESGFFFFILAWVSVCLLWLLDQKALLKVSYSENSKKLYLMPYIFYSSGMRNGWHKNRFLESPSWSMQSVWKGASWNTLLPKKKHFCSKWRHLKFCRRKAASRIFPVCLHPELPCEAECLCARTYAYMGKLLKELHWVSKEKEFAPLNIFAAMSLWVLCV